MNEIVVLNGIGIWRIMILYRGYNFLSPHRYFKFEDAMNAAKTIAEVDKSSVLVFETVALIKCEP